MKKILITFIFIIATCSSMYADVVYHVYKIVEQHKGEMPTVKEKSVDTEGAICRIRIRDNGRFYSIALEGTYWGWFTAEKENVVLSDKSDAYFGAINANGRAFPATAEMLKENGKPYFFMLKCDGSYISCENLFSETEEFRLNNMRRKKAQYSKYVNDSIKGIVKDGTFTQIEVDCPKLWPILQDSRYSKQEYPIYCNIYADGMIAVDSSKTDQESITLFSKIPFTKIVSKGQVYYDEIDKYLPITSKHKITLTKGYYCFSCLKKDLAVKAKYDKKNQVWKVSSPKLGLKMFDWDVNTYFNEHTLEDVEKELSEFIQQELTKYTERGNVTLNVNMAYRCLIMQGACGDIQKITDYIKKETEKYKSYGATVEFPEIGFKEEHRYLEYEVKSVK